MPMGSQQPSNAEETRTAGCAERSARVEEAVQVSIRHRIFAEGNQKTGARFKLRSGKRLAIHGFEIEARRLDW